MRINHSVLFHKPQSSPEDLHFKFCIRVPVETNWLTVHHGSNSRAHSFRLEGLFSVTRGSQHIVGDLRKNTVFGDLEKLQYMLQSLKFII